MSHPLHQPHHPTTFIDFGTADIVEAAAAGKTVSKIVCEAVPPVSRPEPIAKLLTGRERDVFGCMLKGMSNKEIALAFDGTNQTTGGQMSHRTIENYRENIKTKLGVRTSTEAVMMGVREMVGDDVVNQYIATLSSSAN